MGLHFHAALPPRHCDGSVKVSLISSGKSHTLIFASSQPESKTTRDVRNTQPHLMNGWHCLVTYARALASSCSRGVNFSRHFSL